MGSTEKVNVAQKLALFDEHWSPKVVGELNGQHVKLVKLPGEFDWHHHDEEDEMFLVIEGRFSGIGRFGSKRESSSWCRRASSTGRSRMKRPA